MSNVSGPRGAICRAIVTPPLAADLVRARLFVIALVFALAGTARSADDLAITGQMDADPARRADANNESGGQPPAIKSESPTYLRDVLPILMSKCARCHGEPNRVLPDWLDYHTAFNDRVEIRRRVWQSWNGSYYKQPMPAGNGAEAKTMSEAEREIIKRWVEDGAPRGLPPTDGLHSQADGMARGKQLFGIICAVCHQPAGQGVVSRFPPLAASDFLNADKQRAIKVVLNGLRGEVVVNGRKFSGDMPKFPLTDTDVADVLTYVYGSMGNSGKRVTMDEVGAARTGDQAAGVARPRPEANSAPAKNPFE